MPCCQNSTCSGPNLFCLASTNQCIQCGGPNQACCPDGIGGNGCNGGCCDSVNNTCVAPASTCNSAGNICYPTDQCG
jgi:hypothetical protein